MGAASAGIANSAGYVCTPDDQANGVGASSSASSAVNTILFCGSRSSGGGGSLPENGDRTYTYDFDEPTSDNSLRLGCGVAHCDRAAASASRAEWRRPELESDGLRRMQVAHVSVLDTDHINPWTKHLEVDKDPPPSCGGTAVEVLLCGSEERIRPRVSAAGLFVADTPSNGTIILDRKGAPIWKDEPSGPVLTGRVVGNKSYHGSKRTGKNSGALLDQATRKGQPTKQVCDPKIAHMQLEGEEQSVAEMEAKLQDYCESRQDDWATFDQDVPAAQVANHTHMAGRRA